MTVFQQSPLTFSVAGGVATFIIVLLVGIPPYSGDTNTDITKHTLVTARRLRDEFIRARDNLEKSGIADFTRAEEELRKLDDGNGHKWYFAGEIKRISNTKRFTIKSCIKGPLGDTSENLDTYRQDFYRYLEISKTLPASEAGGGMGSEICYDRAKGFCVQRTAWIYHLLANDFYEEAMATADPLARGTKMKRAAALVREARKYRRPEGLEGFEQCTDTIALQQQITEALMTLP